MDPNPLVLTLALTLTSVIELADDGHGLVVVNELPQACLRVWVWGLGLGRSE